MIPTTITELTQKLSEELHKLPFPERMAVATEVCILQMEKMHNRVQTDHVHWTQSPEGAAVIKAHRDAVIAKRQRQAANRASLEESREQAARRMIVVGDIIKCTGTRDGHGIRKVIALEPHEIRASKVTLRTWQTHASKMVLIKSGYELIDGSNYAIKHTGYGSSHGYGKVAYVLRAPDGVDWRWCPL